MLQASLSFTALLLVASHSFCRRKTADLDSADGESTASMASTPQNIPLARVLRDNWRGLLGAGLYCALLTGIRNTWIVALPLRGHHIGLSKIGIGVSVAWFRVCDATVTTIAAGQEGPTIIAPSASRRRMERIDLRFNMFNTFMSGDVTSGVLTSIWAPGFRTKQNRIYGPSMWP